MSYVLLAIFDVIVGIVGLWLIGFSIGVYYWFVAKSFKTGLDFMNNVWKKKNDKT